MPLPVGYVEWGKRTRIIRIWYDYGLVSGG
jgi:hypothetical protein